MTAMAPSLLKQVVAELIGTFTLVLIGIGAVANSTTGNLQLLGVALAFGLAYLVMGSATASISGGHLNPAITFGLVLGGKMPVGRALGYGVAQLAGAVIASVLAAYVFSDGNAGGIQAVANAVTDLAKGLSVTKGIVIEAATTFMLVFVVYGTAVDPAGPKIGAMAIGLTVAMAILLSGPLTGGSMNPARSFGPALIAGKWDHHWVYWVGPLLGGGLAGLLYGRFLLKAG